MRVKKMLKGKDFCSSISFGDRPNADENDPGVRPFLSRPERVQEHEIPDIAGDDCEVLHARRGQKFSIGGLISIGAEIEYGDYIMPAFPQGLRHGGIEVRIKQKPHQARAGRATATSRPHSSGALAWSARIASISCR